MSQRKRPEDLLMSCLLASFRVRFVCTDGADADARTTVLAVLRPGLGVALAGRYLLLEANVCSPRATPPLPKSGTTRGRARDVGSSLVMRRHLAAVSAHDAGSRGPGDSLAPPPARGPVLPRGLCSAGQPVPAVQSEDCADR